MVVVSGLDEYGIDTVQTKVKSGRTAAPSQLSHASRSPRGTPAWGTHVRRAICDASVGYPPLER